LDSEKINKIYIPIPSYSIYSIYPEGGMSITFVAMFNGTMAAMAHPRNNRSVHLRAGHRAGHPPFVKARAGEFLWESSLIYHLVI
jgi:hypothetical protein